MNIAISGDNLSKAYQESDNARVNEIADREYNIIHNDGMTLKIAEDNLYDKIINRIDRRRIKLEKQAEILHDYYADRLLAKELFEQYMSYKNKTSGVASILSLGLIGANMYTRIMRNSIFMGKTGTLATILALQYTGRYLSNNHLESQLERPWKIHSYRMSKGLGPTNIPSNNHREIMTTPLRFIRADITSNDLLFGTKMSYLPKNIDIKFPVDVDHYPYLPEEEDMHKLRSLSTEKFKRLEKIEPEDDGKLIKVGLEAYFGYLEKGHIEHRTYNYYDEMYKSFAMKGSNTIYSPEKIRKRVAFEARDFDEMYKDMSAEKNEYESNPLYADAQSGLPDYAINFDREVNLTEDRIDLLSNRFIYLVVYIVS